jgi:hypothetical protein
MPTTSLPREKDGKEKHEPFYRNAKSRCRETVFRLIRAEGDEKNIEKFIDWCHVCPKGALVEKVEIP